MYFEWIALPIVDENSILPKKGCMPMQPKYTLIKKNSKYLEITANMKFEA